MDRHTGHDLPTKVTSDRVGPYRLLNVIGQGGMATVKLGVFALDQDMGSQVAVKIINKDKLVNEREKTSMAREITIMKLLHHPNILRLHDLLESDEKIYLVLDYYAGGDLYKFISSHGPLRPSVAADLFRQLIDAIDFCHQHMIVHRDLKPENCLLSADHKTLVLSDFGLSTGMHGSRDRLRTRCGTVHYISPEVARGDEYIGMKSDIWSAGVILFTMVTASIPFQGDTPVDILKKVVRRDFVMPANLSDDLQDLINGMLTLDPTDRLQIAEIRRHPWLSLCSKAPVTLPFPYRSLRVRPASKAELEENQTILDNLKLLGWKDKELAELLGSEDRNDAKIFYFLLLEHETKKSAQKPRREIKRSTEPEIEVRVGGRRRAASIGDSLGHTAIVREGKPKEAQPATQPANSAQQQPPPDRVQRKGSGTIQIFVPRSSSQEGGLKPRQRTPDSTTPTTTPTKTKIQPLKWIPNSDQVRSPPKSPRASSPRRSHRVFIRGPVPEPGAGRQRSASIDLVQARKRISPSPSRRSRVVEVQSKISMDEIFDNLKKFFNVIDPEEVEVSEKITKTGIKMEVSIKLKNEDKEDTKAKEDERERSPMSPKKSSLSDRKEREKAEVKDKGEKADKVRDKGNPNDKSIKSKDKKDKETKKEKRKSEKANDKKSKTKPDKSKTENHNDNSENDGKTKSSNRKRKSTKFKIEIEKNEKESTNRLAIRGSKTAQQTQQFKDLSKKINEMEAS